MKMIFLANFIKESEFYQKENKWTIPLKIFHIIPSLIVGRFVLLDAVFLQHGHKQFVGQAILRLARSFAHLAKPFDSCLKMSNHYIQTNKQANN